MQEILKITIDQYTFDCRTDGNAENEMVIFLHGWPETSMMWKKIMSHFSRKGFFCVAPNLRGYSKEACPKGKMHYSLELLSKDVVAISKHFNTTKFHLVGHDWGALIGWQLVHDHRDRILSWTALSVPHPQAFGIAIMNDRAQRKMSRYVRRFQWPYLPERQLRENNFKLLKRLWKHCELEDIEDYLKVFKNSEQLTASINYYRSNYKLLKSAVNKQILGDIHVPTLFIWGNKDIAIGGYSVGESHQYMKSEYEFIALNAGHWLIQTCYPDLEKAIEKHINNHKRASQS